MPIRLEPAEPDQDYPEDAFASLGARAWGNLLWQLFYWDAGLLYDREANAHTFRYDNYGYLIPLTPASQWLPRSGCIWTIL